MKGEVVPTIVGSLRVIVYSVIDERHEPTGWCVHKVGGAPLGPVHALAICRAAPPDEGFYLFYCDDDYNPLTDTWHHSLDDALDQAELEYRGVQATWRECPI